MRDRFVSPISRRNLVAPATVLCTLLSAAAVHADGRVIFKVYDAKTKAPLPGAIIQIDPDESELEGTQFETDSTGKVETGDLVAGVRGFRVFNISTINGISYRRISGRVTIVDGRDVEVEIFLEERPLTEIDVAGQVLRIDVRNTSQSTFRDRKFFDFFPLGVGNRQSVSKLLRAVPGMVPDSINRVHARGQQGGMEVQVDGFLLPDYAQGRASQFLLPDSIDTYRVQTGGHAPSYNGGSGAALDLRLRPGISASPTRPFIPYVEYRLNSADFNGGENYITFGRQIGAPGVWLGRRDPDRSRLGYFLTLSQRYTSNALEAPQGQFQSNNNVGVSQGFTGKVEWRLSNRAEFSSFFTVNSGRNGTANRISLPDSFANVGQGFGFGGRQPLSQFLVQMPNGTIRPQTQGLLGNDVYQKDNNRLFVFQLKSQLTPIFRGLFGIGFGQSTLALSNTTPGVNLSALPVDSSVEFKPTSRQDYESTQLQADFSLDRPGSKHELKFGMLARETRGREGYQFIPQSQTALAALLEFDERIGPRLAPRLVNGVMQTPILQLSRKNDYSAFYVQDTWSVKEAFRLNFGLRTEQSNQFQFFDDPTIGNGRRRSTVTSPRLNIAYQLPSEAGRLRLWRLRLPGLRAPKSQPTVLRASYNRLALFGGLDQGRLQALPTAPQVTDQFDLSVERQIRRQIVKVGIYSKEHQNQIAYRQMILGPQAAAFSTINVGRASAHGFEVSYEFNPRNFTPEPGRLADTKGLAGFLVYHSGQSRRYQGPFSTPGQRFQIFVNDQDQGTTLTAGLGYRYASGMLVGLSYYYGSGLFSSQINGARQAVSEVNLRVSTPERFFNRSFGLEFGVENLFNSRGRYNFLSDFAGTRFQQGRRLQMSVFGKF